jgi:hypothetical protein
MESARRHCLFDGGRGGGLVTGVRIERQWNTFKAIPYATIALGGAEGAA